MGRRKPTAVEIEIEELKEAVLLASDRLGEDFKISGLPFSVRTSNALINSGFDSIRELAQLTPLIRGLGINGIKEIKNSLFTISKEPRPITIERIIENLIPRDYSEIIKERFSLNSKKKTLEIIARGKGLTRERIRQIEAKSLDYLARLIASGLEERDIQKKIIEFADAATPIDSITDLSDVYKNIGVVTLYVALFYPEFEIMKGGVLTKELLILSMEKEEIETEIEKMYDCLIYQEGPVSLKDLYSHLGVEHNLAPFLKKIKVKNGLVYHIENSNIFPTELPMYQRIHEHLLKAGVPQTTEQIAKELNLELRQVGAALSAHNNIFVAIGRSKFALKDEWGYLSGTTTDIAEYYLREANEPLTMSQLVSLIKKQREVNRGSIYAMISSDNRFQRISKDEYALREWQLESCYQKGQKHYPIRTDEVLREIFKERNPQGLSIQEILKKIEENFGEKTSRNYGTVASYLEALTNTGFLEKKKYGRLSYFFRK